MKTGIGMSLKFTQSTLWHVWQQQVEAHSTAAVQVSSDSPSVELHFCFSKDPS